MPAETETATPVTDILDALSEPQEMEETVKEVDDRIKRFVNVGLARTQAQPRKWSYVDLTEDAKKTVIRDAKKYARQAGVVFRVKHDPERPGRLIYRVTVKAPKGE